MLKRSLLLGVFGLVGGYAYALPEGGVVTSGDVTVAAQGNTMTVNVGTKTASLDWQKFDIAQNETVNFQMQKDGFVFNTVVGVNKPSNIDGALIAQGFVYLSNHSGVFIGANSNIDVAGFMATSTTYNPSTGKYYYAPGAGQIVNKGTIRVAMDGIVIFMGPSVINTGKIQGKYLDVLMLVGDKGVAYWNALQSNPNYAAQLEEEGKITYLGDGNWSTTIGTPKVAMYPASVNLQGVSHKTVEDTGTSLRLK